MNAFDTPLTIQQHIVQQQREYPNATGEFSFLLSGLTLATKQIQAKVREGGLGCLQGRADNTNIQGEQQEKLDVFADRTILQSMASRPSVGVVASEEQEHALLLPHANSEQAKYAVIFDPLDGSSNIDVNVSIGTTFSIVRRPDQTAISDGKFDPTSAADWVLQKGTKQVAAGYVMYGSSTIMVYTAGNGVHGFTLDPNVGAFVLSHPDIKMPNQGKYYSVNEANGADFSARFQDFISRLRTDEFGYRYSSRYIGSMVADFHRTLLRGGIFMYPPTAAHPNGKLRLLYEANPIAMIAQQAGGIATDGQQSIMDIQPTEIHQRTSLIVGSRFEMEHFMQSGSLPKMHCDSGVPVQTVLK